MSRPVRILDDKVMPLWCRVVWQCVQDVVAGARGRSPAEGGGDQAVRSAVRFLKSGTCEEICGMSGEEILAAAMSLAERGEARRASRAAMSDGEFLALYDGLGREEAARRCGLSPWGARDRARAARERLALGEGRGGRPLPGDGELLAADTREKREAVAARYGRSDRWVQTMRREAVMRAGRGRRVCPACGAEFGLRSTAQKYCSDGCRERAKRARREAREKGKGDGDGKDG